MSNLTNNYSLLISKLDGFIRKYYVNNILKGTLHTLGILIGSFVVFAMLEHYLYFGQSGRKLLFYSFLGLAAGSLGLLVIKPIMHYFRLGGVISHKQAANIIGEHFENVQDKLLNILDLKEQADQSTSSELLFASINQKSEEIKLVPFQSAIDLSGNRKYLKYALPPLLLLIVILFAAPSMITDSTNRILNNNKDFEKALPFTFSLDTDDLEVIQYGDYDLKVNVEGSIVPDEAFIMIDGYQYRLQKKGTGSFGYTFTNVNKDTEFKIFSGTVSTDDLVLDVIEKPSIVGFDVKLDFPDYIGRANENLSSIGDVIVPMGTKLSWTFQSNHTDDLSIAFGRAGTPTPTKALSADTYVYSKTALKDDQYTVYLSNEALPNADSISYLISVIPDLHPSISVERFIDSMDNKLMYFIGEASDDYGLSSLSFNYQITHEDGSDDGLTTIKMPQPQDRSIQYDYMIDINEFELEPGDQIRYYFEVYDNDGINGIKSSKTSMMAFEKPTIEEYEASAEENNEQIKKDLKDALKESKKIQEELKKLKDKLVQEQEIKWQDKKDLEKLMERQKELEKKMEEAKEKFEENMKNQEEFEETREDIQEKQERLQEMFEEIQNPEMQELMDKLQELMQDLEKDMTLEMMEDMQFNDEELEMQLDRMIEMVKQLEVEKQIKDQIDKLEKLAEEQEKLAEETENQEKPQDELMKEQERLNEEMEKIEEQLKDAQEKNEELENPKNMEMDEEQMEDIQQDMQDSKEQMQKQQNSKSSKAQKSAAQKMKQMAQALAQEMQSGEMEQMQEDMQALRQLLENLIGLSFDQEDLISSISASDINTPKYVELVRYQYKLKDDFQLVQDSLHALSKRVSQIETFITEKVSEVKSNMGESLEQLEERKKPEASNHQQRIMKNVNDLALMLNEAMEQMQQQMSGMMAGSQMCDKPGSGSQNGSVPKDKIGQGQQQLNEEMKQMREQMGKDGKEGSAAEFAKMAAKQAALRKALRELSEERRGQGLGDKEMEELIEQMDKIETDLVNKRLTNEMLERQQEILTRLLESDKADREKEMEKKRKAESAQQKERSLPPSLQEYLKKREQEIEKFNKVSPTLRPYYKQLVEEYFKALKRKG